MIPSDGPQLTNSILQPSRKHLETIGEKEWELEERSLNVHDDVALWDENPRLQVQLADSEVSSETELEAALQQTKGYDRLKKSIDELGQMTPVYVQQLETGKYLVLEGATRVTILRQLDRKYTGGIKEGTFRKVKAKILPINFSPTDRAVLLASIHVRGTSVRNWDRYIQAKFVYETVVGTPTRPALMNQAQLARYMGKTDPWVNRLKMAYEFSLQFIEHVDDDRAGKLAVSNFSILEEISRVKFLGPQLRDYLNSKFDDLRDDVFTMVEKEVFKEYRDARFLKEFHDDPDKWAQLKTGEKHIANRLAAEVKTNSSSAKARIASLPESVRRTIDAETVEFDEDDISYLEQTISQIKNKVHEGVRPFRIDLKKITSSLSEVSMADVKEVELDEIAAFQEALEHFQYLLSKHGKKA